MSKKKMGFSSFFCWNCGERIEKTKQLCPNCGARYAGKDKYGDRPALGAGGIGWSDQAGHPCFEGYAKKYRKYSYIWLIGLSVLIPGCMLATGELEATAEGLMVIGIIVGVFWAFGLFFLHKQYGKNHPDWDGTVENKQIIQKTRTKKNQDGSRYKESYTEFVVSIRRQDGSLYDLTTENQSTIYDYYHVGDYVHYHGSKYLKYIEKYDKSLDTVIFCASCHRMCDARDNFCEACGSVLLKGAPVTTQPPQTAVSP